MNDFLRIFSMLRNFNLKYQNVIEQVNSSETKKASFQNGFVLLCDLCCDV
jgi:hypothetical protein